MLLRMAQHELGEGRQRVTLRWEGDGPPREGEATFSFQLTSQDEEDLRWYMEDFLQYPQDPAPKVARRVEKRMMALGEELFRAVFQGSEETRELWVLVRERLSETRVEIDTSVALGTTLPWELLRDPRGAEVALSARSFVRTQPRGPQRARVPSGVDGPVRILVVICRPGGGADVPTTNPNRNPQGPRQAGRAPAMPAPVPLARHSEETEDDRYPLHLRSRRRRRHRRQHRPPGIFR